MSDRPIPFSAPMILAIDAGLKTKTRRVLNPQPDVSKLSAPYRPEPRGGRSWIFMQRVDAPGYAFAGGDFKVGYAVGDRLWAREAWRTDISADEIPPRELSLKDPIRYEADRAWKNQPPVDGRLRPAMFMCRWMSRFTLTVIAVKVERLQEISEADAQAEGVGAIYASWRNGFECLWNSLHGLDAWDANPWVGAYTFSVEKRNIDAPVQGAKLASAAR